MKAPRPKPKTQTARLEVHTITRQLDQQNFGLYRKLKENEADCKEIEKMLGYTLPLWMIGSMNDGDHAELLWRFNRMANAGWYTSLAKHPELRCKLLACVGLGRETRHNFVKVTKAPSSTELEDLLRMKYPDIRSNEVLLWCRRNDEETVRDFAAVYGLQEDETDKVVSEYRKFVVATG